MSAGRNEGLEAAAKWHDEQAKVYADDAASMRLAVETEERLNPQSDEARIDKYDALANEHRASAAIFRGMVSA